MQGGILKLGGNKSYLPLLLSKLTQIKNGMITVIKQDNTVIQLNFNEKYTENEEEFTMSGSDTNIDNVISDSTLQVLIQYINSVQYGSVTLSIQDGKVVQIEKNEKIKLR